MIHMPAELKTIVSETERLLTEIGQLKAKKRPLVADLRKIAELKTELTAICPPERYAWVDGLPVADILKKLHKIEKENEIMKDDQYLRNVSEIKPPLGMTAYDFARVNPGPSLVRTYETVHGQEQGVFPKSREHLLCKGAAVGIDESGRCCHFWPELDLRFVGFLEQGCDETRAVVKTRGSVILKIEGATESDRGRAVYCLGPNSFTLAKVPGAAEIGKIRYVQGDRAAVAFRREGDDRPLNLDLR